MSMVHPTQEILLSKSKNRALPTLRKVLTNYKFLTFFSPNLSGLFLSEKRVEAIICQDNARNQRSGI